MKDQDHLFELISSMSKPEKRFFKLFASNYSGDKVYIRLFDTIEKLDTYDEQEIVKSLNIKGFPVVKNYLYNLLLKSMRILRDEKSTNDFLRGQMANAELLLEKGLFKQCEKVLKKAKAKASAYERVSYAMEIRQLEYKLAIASMDFQLIEQLASGKLEETSKHIDEYQNLMECRHISLVHHFERLKRGNAVRSDAEHKRATKAIENYLRYGPQFAKSYKARMFYYNTMETHYYTLEEVRKAYDIGQAHIRHLESKPLLLKEEIHSYLVTLHNLMNAQIQLKKYGALKKTIVHLQSLAAQFPAHSVRIFKSTSTSMLEYHLRTQTFQEGINYFKTIESQFNMYKDKFDQHGIYTFIADVSELHFFSGDLSKALYWNNKLINDPAIKNHAEYHMAAKMAFLIINHELNNEGIVESAIRSYTKQLRKDPEKYRLENNLVYTIKALSEPSSNKEKIKILQQFRYTITQLSNNPYEKISIYSFDLLYWVDTKISKLQNNK